MIGRWHPHRTNSHYGPPPVGQLIAYEHAVWRVTAVTDLMLSEADREIWLAAGMPDQDTWRGRPYRVDVQFVGGARPAWAEHEETDLSGHADTPAISGGGRLWYLYPTSGRWPACSCCGEPMPCRAELEDRDVTESLAQVEKMVTRLPGTCWGCGEPITNRQKSVTYPGDNMDLPGGPAVRFHTRATCHGVAQRYELRWIAVDPRRERILTYPKCGGILIVHADGSSECRAGQGPLGDEQAMRPDCRGHLTHDHGTVAACFVGDGWFDRPEQMNGCPRGCSREGHPGARTPPRPPRTQTALADDAA